MVHPGRSTTDFQMKNLFNNAAIHSSTINSFKETEIYPFCSGVNKEQNYCISQKLQME